ncbi:MAG TPA: hypothetical protein VKY92_03735 [Verrucomicrobiae bacterium]|nr:hypothetical protein [Verrucomicrobiae bacterium]
MRNKFYLGIVALAVIGGACIYAVRIYQGPHKYEALSPDEIYRARLKMNPNLASEATVKVVPLPEKRVVRLAIGSLGLADDRRNGDLMDLVTTGLSGAQGLELVERQSLDKVLSELQLSLSGLVRAKDAVKAGRLLRADWFLLGTSTTLGGTKALVVRLVDARTGTLRDAGIFSAEQNSTALASAVATFVQKSRSNSSSLKQPVFLGIGTFEDFSANSRQADFPTQLRGYLTGAFRGSQVRMVEREYVDTLLQEVHLDMAGLSDEAAGDPPTPMQSAFWLVSGNYQSYETTSFKVEVDLEVARVFGPSKHIHLVEEPGERINLKIKDTVEQVLNEGGPVYPNRRSEVRLQMGHGESLADIDRGYGNPDLVHLGSFAQEELDPRASFRKRRNLEEALRAFQTVLLLDPTNQEAKLWIAACLRSRVLQRNEEARQIYRDVLERPAQDKWSEIAKQALIWSFDYYDTVPKASWFETAAALTSNPDAAQFYRQQAESLKKEKLLNQIGPEAQALAEERVWYHVTNAVWGGTGASMVEEFVHSYGTNKAGAARRLAELYPVFKARAPETEAYLLAAVVSGQVETNAPPVLEFQQLLESLTAHPETVYKPSAFWLFTQNDVLEWSWKHQDYRLATRYLEGKKAASAVYTDLATVTNHEPSVRMTDEDRMALAYAYLGTQEWDKALALFEKFSGQLFSMLMDGPWGDHNTVLFTDRLADFCRKNMGQDPLAKLHEFNPGKPVLPLCFDQILTMDEGGFWITVNNRLLHLDFDLHTNAVVEVPVHAPITAVCASSTNLWIGTDGAGLFEFDKATGRLKQLKEKDGLLMDNIAALYLSSTNLWVGYGRKARREIHNTDGGLGKIDLCTYKSTSFMPPLAEHPEIEKWSLANGTGPTRASVVAIAEAQPNDIWLLVGGPPGSLWRYRPGQNTWEPEVYSCYCLAQAPQSLLIGKYWNHFREDKDGVLGVVRMDLSSANSPGHDFKKPEGVPPGCVTTLKVDGVNVWVGGFGYVARFDLATEEVKALAHIQADEIERLEVGGGYLWIQAKCWLYRVPLSSIP